MATAEELDNKPEGQEAREVGIEQAEVLPNSGETAADLMIREDQALLDSADRETAEAAAMGADATEARQEFQTDLAAAEQATKGSIALAMEALKLQQSDPLNPETLKRAMEMFAESRLLSEKEAAEDRQLIREEVGAARAAAGAEAARKIEELARQTAGSAPEAGAPDAAPGSPEDLAAEVGEREAEDETGPEADEDIVDLEPPEMTEKWTDEEEAERAAEAVSVLTRTEKPDSTAAAERAQELMAQAAQTTDETEKKRLMDEAWEMNKQALRKGETAESGEPETQEDILDKLMPEGVSDEWEALSVKGGTIEDQVRREEQAAERAVRDRINKERSEAVRNMTELQAEMKNEGIDIIRLEDILSDPDTASENLDAYDDRVLEKYRELLSRQMTTIGVGKRSLEVTANDARKEMSSIEDEDRASGMETGEDGTTALVRFVDIEGQLDIAEDHLNGMRQEIEETTDPERKAALEMEAQDLEAHVRSLEDAGSAIIDTAHAKGQEDAFIDRVGKFKAKKSALEDTLTDIEVLSGLELQSMVQAELLDAIVTEERDRSVQIEVDESGDEVGKENADTAEPALPATAAAVKPVEKPKSPVSTGGNLSRSGAAWPMKSKEGKEARRETVGEAAKRYAKETWQDITSILNDVMKTIPGL